MTSRRGQFWIPGDVVSSPFGTVQRGPMYVSWEAPEVITQPHPIVLVHGGGGQGSEWLSTVDGKPGMAAHLVSAGFATYVVDRPGHGRSPYHPDVIGPMGPPISYEVAVGLFAPPARASEHSQWPFGREVGAHELDQLVAGLGPLPVDLADSQKMDAARLVSLMELIGPAVLLTHSAGAPAGWLVLDTIPEHVVGIATIEPIGPPFARYPIGSLDWGLTAAPVGFAGEFESPTQIRQSSEAGLEVATFVGKPVALFTGSASEFRDFASATVAFLRTMGADATWVDLEDHAVSGNGHGLIFEHNVEEVAKPVIDWIIGLAVSTG